MKKDIRRKYERSRRFWAGIREITVYHYAKLLIPLTYLLVLFLVWKICISAFSVLSKNEIVVKSVSFSLLFVGIVGLVEVVVILGTPRKAQTTQNALVEAGFTNALHSPPLLLSVRKAGSRHIYEFDANNTPFSRWEQERAKIAAALHSTIDHLEPSTDGRRVLVYVAVAYAALPSKIDWKAEYIPKEDFVLALGMGLSGLETVDLSTTPHLLLGGGTGSGKSILLKSLLMQSCLKGATVIIADFKGGVDFSPIWHDNCQMVFDTQTLLPVLADLTAELEHCRTLFVAAGTPNIAKYNQVTGEQLTRYILAFDEVAEVFDMSGLDKSEKDVVAQITRHLSLIARQGRAFGLHLLLSTQRPSADLIPGQIRTNLSLRICGRADEILSKIILDSSAAAEQIQLNEQGRFVTNTGRIFQGFWFDDSMLDTSGNHA